MKENSQQPQLEHFLCQHRRGLGRMPPLEQLRQAKCALQGVLKIMIGGIDRLVIRVVAGKALAGPMEDAGDKGDLSLGKEPSINRVDSGFNRARNSSVNWAQHARILASFKSFALLFGAFTTISIELNERMGKTDRHAQMLDSSKAPPNPAMKPR